jgi:di/tricarboxylate transporter
MEKLDKQMQKKFLNTFIGLCLMFLFKYLPTLGVSPVLLTVLIASISNYAFATPAATLQMTIAMGSGWVEPGKMFKMGVVTMLIAIVIMIVVGMPILQLFY